MIENGYRTYLPEIGAYLQSDPLHSSSVQGVMGPQAYSYAAWNPQTYVDPDGRFRISGGDAAAHPGLEKLLKEIMPGIGANQSVKNAYKTIFPSGPASIAGDFAFGSGPQVKYSMQFLADNWGDVDGHVYVDSPNVIHVKGPRIDAIGECCSTNLNPLIRIIMHELTHSYDLKGVAVALPYVPFTHANSPAAHEDLGFQLENLLDND